MKLTEIVDKLNLEVVTEITHDNEIEDVYIGDLLSVVMSKSKENSLWLTIQTHANVIAVASLVGLGGVVVVEGMKVEEDTIAKARAEEIPILRTELSAFKIACKLNALGI